MSRYPGNTHPCWNVSKSVLDSMGVSWHKFCADSSLSYQTLRNYLNGSRPMPVLYLEKLADYCGASTDFLLGRVKGGAMTVSDSPPKYVAGRRFQAEIDEKEIHPFWQRLEALLVELKTNRAQLCRHYNISPSSINNYWYTKRLPPSHLLEKISDFTGASLDYLVFGYEETQIAEKELTETQKELYKLEEKMQESERRELVGAAKIILAK